MAGWCCATRRSMCSPRLTTWLPKSRRLSGGAGHRGDDCTQCSTSRGEHESHRARPREWSTSRIRPVAVTDPALNARNAPLPEASTRFIAHAPGSGASVAEKGSDANAGALVAGGHYSRGDRCPARRDDPQRTHGGDHESADDGEQVRSQQSGGEDHQRG